jgi:hypothetical protein
MNLNNEHGTLRSLRLVRLLRLSDQFITFTMRKLLNSSMFPRFGSDSWIPCPWLRGRWGSTRWRALAVR